MVTIRAPLRHPKIALAAMLKALALRSGELESLSSRFARL
jgi:hypothetical protein